MADKVVIVTGANRGLGRTLVDVFAGEGWQVAAVGRSAKPDGFPAEPSVRYHQFEASDFGACQAFWQQLAADHPDSEVHLINNAGGWVSGSLVGSNPDDFMQQMQSTYFTAVYMTKALVAAVPKARIINLISASALQPNANESAYTAAKAAEQLFFQSVRNEYAPEQYQFTNLYPQNIATNGPNPKAIDPKELADYIVAIAKTNASYYLRDVSLYPAHTA